MAKKKIEPVEVELEIDLDGDEIDDLEELELDEPLIEDDEDALLDDDEDDDDSMGATIVRKPGDDDDDDTEGSGSDDESGDGETDDDVELVDGEYHNNPELLEDAGDDNERRNSVPCANPAQCLDAVGDGLARRTQSFVRKGFPGWENCHIFFGNKIGKCVR